VSPPSRPGLQQASTKIPTSGSGKSTLSKAVRAQYPTFKRLSIDAHIWDAHGAYGIDYPPSRCAALQDEAEAFLHGDLLRLLRGKAHDVILDFAFAFREMRDEWRAIVEEGGGRVVLVYLDAGEEMLWRRIGERRARPVDADSVAGNEISRETLRMYYEGFERPVGEGEVVIKVE
jgi:gluconate kinase